MRYCDVLNCLPIVFIIPWISHSFSLQGIFCVSLNTVAFPVWWSHGVAFLATYLLLDQRHGIFMLLRTSVRANGGTETCNTILDWIYINEEFFLGGKMQSLNSPYIQPMLHWRVGVLWILHWRVGVLLFRSSLGKFTKAPGHSWGGNIFETYLSICKAGDYGLAPEQQSFKQCGCLEISNDWIFRNWCFEEAWSSKNLVKLQFAENVISRDAIAFRLWESFINLIQWSVQQKWCFCKVTRWKCGFGRASTASTIIWCRLCWISIVIYSSVCMCAFSRVSFFCVYEHVWKMSTSLCIIHIALGVTHFVSNPLNYL